MSEDNKLNLELNAETAKGSYSNLAIVSHSPSEFVVDFAKVLPAMPKAIVSERIIMAPENAKRLLMALNENVQKFEAEFGPIVFKTPKEDGVIPPIPFGSPKGLA